MTAAQNPLTPSPFSMHASSFDLPTPARALAVGAHPDDVDFGCGATLAKWAADGCEVHIVVCTDGSKGTWDPTTDQTELVATRRREQSEAAARLGATGEVAFLGQVDGELDSDLETRKQLAYWIRRTQPETVLGHDPWKRYRLHPDHRHAGLLTTDAIVAARDPLFFPDLGVRHHRPDQLLLFEADEPDHVELVGDHLETKVKALLAHESQFESTMGSRDDPELVEFAKRVERKAIEAGRAAGVGPAEVYKLIGDL